MPERCEVVPLLHMLDHTREAMALAQGRARVDLDSDRILELALVRLLEVVGEAANRVPRGVRARHLEIPWSQIAALRNRLIHAYDAVDLDLLGRSSHTTCLHSRQLYKASQRGMTPCRRTRSRMGFMSINRPV